MLTQPPLCKPCMTSALELFYNRRSRVGRTPDPFDPSSDFGSHPHLDRTNRRHRTHNSPAAITLASIGSIQMAAIRCAALIITRDHSRYIALLLLPTLLKNGNQLRWKTMGTYFLLEIMLVVTLMYEIG